MTSNQCQNPGKECQGGSSWGYSSWCHQEYREYKILAHGEDKEKQVQEVFKYPSCCVCKLGKPKKESKGLK